jgi:hypothetical protein
MLEGTCPFQLLQKNVASQASPGPNNFTPKYDAALLEDSELFGDLLFAPDGRFMKCEKPVALYRYTRAGAL